MCKYMCKHIFIHILDIMSSYCYLQFPQCALISLAHLYVLSFTLRATLASHSINTFTYLLNPVICLICFQNCFIHAASKSKLTERNSRFICHSFHTFHPMRYLWLNSQILCLWVVWLFFVFSLPYVWLWYYLKYIWSICFILLFILDFPFHLYWANFIFWILRTLTWFQRTELYKKELFWTCHPQTPQHPFPFILLSLHQPSK
jgi:hypothetical protein